MDIKGGVAMLEDIHILPSHVAHAKEYRRLYMICIWYEVSYNYTIECVKERHTHEVIRTLVSMMWL